MRAIHQAKNNLLINHPTTRTKQLTKLSRSQEPQLIRNNQSNQKLQMISNMNMVKMKWRRKRAKRLIFRASATT